MFGVWDSRDTSAKVPRLIFVYRPAHSNARDYTRSANFLTQMTIDLAKLHILPGAESKDGFANALASKGSGRCPARDERFRSVATPRSAWLHSGG